MKLAIALSCIAAFALSACVTDGPRTVSGKSFEVTNSHQIEPADAAVNLPLFFRPDFFQRIESATLDNQVLRNTFTVRGDDGNGQIVVHHIGVHGFQRSEMLKDRSAATKRAKEMGYGDISAFTDIFRKNERVGLRAETTRTSERCIMATAAYQLGSPVVGGRTEPADTWIQVDYCGTPKDPAMFDKMLSELELVKDRAAFKAALQAAAK